MHKKIKIGKSGSDFLITETVKAYIAGEDERGSKLVDAWVESFKKDEEARKEEIKKIVDGFVKRFEEGRRKK